MLTWPYLQLKNYTFLWRFTYTETFSHSFQPNQLCENGRDKTVWRYLFSSKAIEQFQVENFEMSKCLADIFFRFEFTWSSGWFSRSTVTGVTLAAGLATGRAFYTAHLSNLISAKTQARFFQSLFSCHRKPIPFFSRKQMTGKSSWLYTLSPTGPSQPPKEQVSCGIHNKDSKCLLFVWPDALRSPSPLLLLSQTTFADPHAARLNSNYLQRTWRLPSMSFRLSFIGSTTMHYYSVFCSS